MRLERGKALGGSGKRFTDAIKSLLCCVKPPQTAAPAHCLQFTLLHERAVSILLIREDENNFCLCMCNRDGDQSR